MPNNDKQGVYAFIKNDVITYIGVSSGRCKIGYKGYGLGNRVNSGYIETSLE